MKKLSAFIVAFTLFFSAAPLALAIVPGSFTVSNYAYDPSTKHLTFDISNLNPGTPDYSVSNGDVNLYSYNANAYVGASQFGDPNFACSTTHCDVTFTYAENTAFNSTDTFNIEIFDQTTSYKSQQFTFTPPNHAPIAIAGTSLDVNNNLQLDGSLSSDPDNDPLTYTWQIAGETSTRSGKTTSISDLTSGTYNVTLTVSDGSLQSVAITTIGVVTKRPTSTVGMTISSMQINKATGSYKINGTWDTTNPLFGTVLSSPKSRLLFELQTGGTSTNPIYGIVGENMISLTTMGNMLH